MFKIMQLTHSLFRHSTVHDIFLPVLNASIYRHKLNWKTCFDIVFLYFHHFWQLGRHIGQSFLYRVEKGPCQRLIWKTDTVLFFQKPWWERKNITWNTIENNKKMQIFLFFECFICLQLIENCILNNVFSVPLNSLVFASTFQFLCFKEICQIKTKCFILLALWFNLCVISPLTVQHKY